MATTLTPEAIDAVVDNMQAALGRVNRCQESSVKLPGAEFDLLRHIEEARDFMTALVKEADRSHLHQIFGGDCSRISHIRAVLEKATFSDMHKNDQRLRTCIAACESVEAVLLDSGFGAKLKQAQEEERNKLLSSLDAARKDDAKLSEARVEDQELGDEASPPEVAEIVEETTEDGSRLGVSENAEEATQGVEVSQGLVDEFQLNACETHTLAACALENCAIELDRSSNVADAICKYHECSLELQLAIEAALPAYVADHGRLVKHREEVIQRMDYLKSLEGSEPSIPVEEHIHPVQLDMCADMVSEVSETDLAEKQRKNKNAAMVAAGSVAAGALVFSGGFLVLGAAAALGTAATVTSATLMGGTVAGATAGAVGTGYAVTYHSEKVDSVSDRVSSAAANTAVKVRQFSTEMGLDKHATKVGETGSLVKEKAKQGYSDLKKKVSNADLGAKLATTKSKVAEKGGSFLEKGAAVSASMGDKLFNKFTSKKSLTTGGSSTISGLVGKAQSFTSSFVGGSSSSSSAKASTGETTKEAEVPALHDLRIEVLRASSLADPKYRVGDLTSSVASKLLGSGSNHLAAVYVELEVGRKKMTTDTAETTKSESEGHNVEFSDERLLFPYRNETEVPVVVRDRRSIQATVRGDPLIGEGKLALQVADLMEMQLRSVEVPLMSDSKPVGTVSLRYQLLPAMGSQQARPDLLRQESTISTDFHTPPGSPRDS